MGSKNVVLSYIIHVAKILTFACTFISDGLWCMSCKICCKRTVPNGNAYRCTSNCSCTEVTHRFAAASLALFRQYVHMLGQITKAAPICRYILCIIAKDTEPNEENKEIIGQFMFLGDQGKTLTGHDAALVVTTRRGKSSDPPQL